MRILAGPHQGGQTRPGRSPTKFTKAIRGEAPPPGQVGARPHQVHESNRGRGPVKLSLDSDPWPQRGRGEAFFRPRNVSGAVRETRGEAPELNNRLSNQRTVLFNVERNRSYSAQCRAKPRLYSNFAARRRLHAVAQSKAGRRRRRL